MENNSKKFHKLTPQIKLIAGIVGLFIVVVVLPIISFFYYKVAINRPAQGFKETTFEITEGTAIANISKDLYESELINSEFLFRLHLKISGLHTNIQAGIFNIPAGASVVELAKIFQHGTNDVRITFLEGWRAEEFALQASKNLRKVDYEKFIKLAKKEEGYLFPDTYFFSTEATEEEVLDKLAQNFEDKTANILTQKNLDKAELSKENVVIFASILEREVFRVEDQKVVAGILISRWKNAELIGADATTQYSVATLDVCSEDLCPNEETAKVLDWWPQELSVEDLDYDSPYNTRKNVGLPPKAISNPSISSIEAVLNHQETSYNYYLTDENGIAHYANTLEEHNRNISQYLY